ncbi:MAG: hypothetical protein ACOH2F_16675 [Cellulomonas sp.]
MTESRSPTLDAVFPRIALPAEVAAQARGVEVDADDAEIFAQAVEVGFE